jgi:hypothetical protein
VIGESAGLRHDEWSCDDCGARFVPGWQADEMVRIATAEKYARGDAWREWLKFENEIQKRLFPVPLFSEAQLPEITGIPTVTLMRDQLIRFRSIFSLALAQLSELLGEDVLHKSALDVAVLCREFSQKQCATEFAIEPFVTKYVAMKRRHSGQDDCVVPVEWLRALYDLTPPVPGLDE